MHYQTLRKGGNGLTFGKISFDMLEKGQNPAMKFQFSIARLLMATTIVALTFGLARLMLDKAISSFVVLIAVLAADLGLLVLVAQKKGDLLRILRMLTGIFAIIFFFAAIKMETFLALSVAFTISILMIIISVLLSRKIDLLELEANEPKADILDETPDSKNS